MAISKLFLASGIKEVILCDRQGVICAGDPKLTPAKQEIAAYSNKKQLQGKLGRRA